MLIKACLSENLRLMSYSDLNVRTILQHLRHIYYYLNWFAESFLCHSLSCYFYKHSLLLLLLLFSSLKKYSETKLILVLMTCLIQSFKY